MVKNLLLKIEPDLDMRIDLLTALNNKIKRKYCIELLTEIITQKENEMVHAPRKESRPTITYQHNEE